MDPASHENDWSYQNPTGPPDYDAVSFAGMTPYIPVYDNGVLLWGKEPPIAGQTPPPTTTIPPVTTPPSVTYGDINDDGSINSTDYALLKRVLLGTASSSINLAAADVNLDGEVNSTDYAVLKRYLLGLVNALPL